jgi:hypothetical protein
MTSRREDTGPEGGATSADVADVTWLPKTGLPKTGLPKTAANVTWLRAFQADLAPHDWLITVYFILLFVAVVFGAGPDRLLAGRIVLEHLFVLVVGLALTRGAILRRGSFLSALVYRFTLFSTVLSSYFELRVILPASAPRAVDASLYAIDLNVFHYEPALAWDRFVNVHTVEWFAFFYFGYFFLLAIHVLPFMFFARNLTMLARFATAIFFTFCCGHLLYILVPGYGPYHYFAGSFPHELQGGLYWGLVKATVADAGAQKDIFPSLHTAVPTMFTLLAFKYRQEHLPFRYSWPLMGFCASQIIIATMFLRWHYLIDICAGVALAALAVSVADHAVRWDDARRERLGLAPAWGVLKLF